MKELQAADASALSLLAESPNAGTKRLVLNDLSPEARKIAEEMVRQAAVRRKTQTTGAKTRPRTSKRSKTAVQSSAEALLRWSE
jgi:hypothetical protein